MHTATHTCMPAMDLRIPIRPLMWTTIFTHTQSMFVSDIHIEKMCLFFVCSFYLANISEGSSMMDLIIYIYSTITTEIWSIILPQISLSLYLSLTLSAHMMLLRVYVRRVSVCP